MLRSLTDFIFRIIASALLVVALAGCAEYFDRRDGITRSAGDAPRLNARAHTIDPWPQVAADQRTPMSGERARTAIERYRTNETFTPSAQSTSSVKQQASTVN